MFEHKDALLVANHNVGILFVGDEAGDDLGANARVVVNQTKGTNVRHVVETDNYAKALSSASISLRQKCVPIASEIPANDVAFVQIVLCGSCQTAADNGLGLNEINVAVRGLRSAIVGGRIMEGVSTEDIMNSKIGDGVTHMRDVVVFN